MKKKLLKYFYLVILTFIGNIVFANSNVDFSANSFSKTISSDEEFHLQELEKLVVFYKQTDANYETHHDKIEISESELEQEDTEYSIFDNYFNFFSAYFDTNVCANHSQFIQNRLAPCKYIDYLSTIPSRNIFYCVFRI